MVEHTVIPDADLARAPGLRAIVFMGTGAGTYVDAALAARHGVAVLTTPGYGSVAVAEHAFALMMAGARRIARMDRDPRRLGSRAAGCSWRAARWRCWVWAASGGPSPNAAPPSA